MKRCPPLPLASQTTTQSRHSAEEVYWKTRRRQRHSCCCCYRSLLLALVAAPRPRPAAVPRPPTAAALPVAAAVCAAYGGPAPGFGNREGEAKASTPWAASAASSAFSSGRAGRRVAIAPRLLKLRPRRRARLGWARWHAEISAWSRVVWRSRWSSHAVRDAVGGGPRSLSSRCTSASRSALLAAVFSSSPDGSEEGAIAAAR